MVISYNEYITKAELPNYVVSNPYKTLRNFGKDPASFLKKLTPGAISILGTGDKPDAF
jgi:hypothetical protein